MNHANLNRATNKRLWIIGLKHTAAYSFQIRFFHMTMHISLQSERSQLLSVIGSPTLPTEETVLLFRLVWLTAGARPRANE